MHVEPSWMLSAAAPPSESKAEEVEPGAFEQILTAQQNTESEEALLIQPNATGILPDFTLNPETDSEVEGAPVPEDERQEVLEPAALASMVQSVYWQTTHAELPVLAMATTLGFASEGIKVDATTFASAPRQPGSAVFTAPSGDPVVAPAVTLEEAAPFLKLAPSSLPVTAATTEGTVEIVNLEKSESPQAGWDSEMAAAVGLTRMAGGVEDRLNLRTPATVTESGYTPQAVGQRAPLAMAPVVGAVLPAQQPVVAYEATQQNVIGSVTVTPSATPQNPVVATTAPQPTPVQNKQVLAGVNQPQMVDSKVASPAVDQPMAPDSAIAAKPITEVAAATPGLAPKPEPAKPQQVAVISETEAEPVPALLETAKAPSMASNKESELIGIKPTAQPVSQETEVREAATSEPKANSQEPTPVITTDRQPEATRRAEAPTPTTTEVEPREILRQAIEQIEKLQEMRPPTRMTMTLTPEDLGTIQVTLTKSGGETHATLHSSNPVVHAALQQGKEQMMQAAEAKGLSFSSFDLTQGQTQQGQEQNLNRQDFDRMVNLRQTPTADETIAPTHSRLASTDRLDVRI